MLGHFIPELCITTFSKIDTVFSSISKKINFHSKN